MGNPFSIPCDPCVDPIFRCLDEKGTYILKLKKNLVALDEAMVDLRAKREDLLRRVTREEEHGLERLAVIKVWLNKVETIENTFDNLLVERDSQLQRLCLCGFCSKSLRSSYRYGRLVFVALRKVQELNREEFEVVAGPRQISEVEEIQLQPIIVGQETMLDEAWQHIKNDGVGMIGIFGMGGVGKTTLITQLNNKFSGERLGFDFVIWVVVSKELSAEKILNEIAAKIGIGGDEWEKKDKSRKTNIIYNFLRKKKFMLFLDDIWEKVDLAMIGVPFPTLENGCKVAFTTRSRDVCTRMGAKVLMEVECLDDDKALDLFQQKVGQRTLESHPEIPDLAKIVAKKCSGLPLALNIIGETMSSKRSVQEWRDAINDLTSYMRNFSYMEDKILPLLKYSYDDLKGEHLKQSLLYCALFPEDDIILKAQLVDYWICEGIIDGSESIENAENKGYEIIGSLVSASLLMEMVNENHGRKDIVFMHDVVREMALWIASDMGKEKEAYIVRAGVGLTKTIEVKNWNVVKRMSLMKNKTTKGYIHKLVGKPECPELTTLLLQDSDLKRISREFFKSMPKLAVLDLSDNDNTALSDSLDGISELGSLQFLNLSYTAIRRLPKNLQRLEKLIHLNLNWTYELSSIIGISRMKSLKVLELVHSAISWDLGTVRELEKLKHLEILNTGFDYPKYLEKFLSSRRLTSCTRDLWIRDIKKSSGISLPVTMDTLRYFSILKSNITEIKMGRTCIQSNPRNPSLSSLISLSIVRCHGLRELTLLMYAPNLEHLYVENARELEDIINKEKACEGEEESEIVPFQKLSFLWLNCLPKLKSIYWKPLTFPALKEIDVRSCPLLIDKPTVASYQN